VIASAMRRTASRAFTLGLPHYLLSVLAIQGTAYATQFVLARMLGPRDFGIVRSVEAVIAIALVFGAAGMPSLAIKSIAEAGDAGARGRVLLRLLTLAVLVSLVTAAVVAVLDQLLFDPLTASYTRRLIWVVPISAIARTALNYHQGVKSVHRVSIVAAAMSVVSLLATVALVARWAMPGWVLARYVAETLLAGTMLWTVRHVLRGRTVAGPDFAHGALLHLGLAIAASLLVRTGIDNIGVLGMGMTGVPKSDVGYFAIAALMASALLLVPGALANLSLPAVIESLHSRRTAERTSARLLAAAMALSLPPVVVLLWLATPLARLLAPAYLPGVPIIRVLLLAVPLRVVTSIAGGVLLATGRVHSTLVMNLLTLATGAIALTLWIPREAAMGAAYATVLMEGVSTLCYTAWSVRALRRLAPAPHPPTQR
jgi:O-antigen/teichoic acid export membrane protein